MPDVERSRRAARRVMTDACEVYRDPQGTDDDVLDPNTLELSRRAGDRRVTYSGVCMVRSTSARVPTQAAGREAARPRWRLRLPPDSDARVGDVVVVTECADESSVVGRELLAVEVGGGNLAVTRVLVCEEVTAATLR